MTVPGPVGLGVERELHKSLLVSWNPPQFPPPWPIKSYQLFVNGVLRATVTEEEDTRALVEGLQPDKVCHVMGDDEGWLWNSLC